MTSTHIHEGPDTMGLWGRRSRPTSGVDVGYLDFVNDEVAAASPRRTRRWRRRSSGSRPGTRATPRCRPGPTSCRRPRAPGDGDPGGVPRRRDRGSRRAGRSPAGRQPERAGAPAPRPRDAARRSRRRSTTRATPRCSRDDNRSLTSRLPALRARGASSASTAASRSTSRADLGVLQGPLGVDVHRSASPASPRRRARSARRR